LFVPQIIPFTVCWFCLSQNWTLTRLTTFLCPTRHNPGYIGNGLHSQSLDWYWQTKQYRKIHKWNIAKKTNNTKAKQNYPGSVSKKSKVLSQASMAHRAALISVSLALSRTPAEAARPRIRGQCIALYARLLPHLWLVLISRPWRDGTL